MGYQSVSHTHSLVFLTNICVVLLHKLLHFLELRFFFLHFITLKKINHMHKASLQLTCIINSPQSPCMIPERRHQNASSQPTNEEAAYQWTETHHVTQGQPQYGYNYHHIDQRTENQGIYLTCGATRPSSLPNSTDVYAEFTSETTAVLHGCEQMQGYYEHRAGVEYILDNSKVQYRVERHFGEDSSSVSSQPQCSQYQDKDQYQYEADPPHYQPSYQSDVHTEREDHVSYVPEGYVHFLLSR